VNAADKLLQVVTLSLTTIIYLPFVLIQLISNFIACACACYFDFSACLHTLFELFYLHLMRTGEFCLLLNMNSTNETLLFDRFLIMYNLCVFTCIILMFVFHCTHVQITYLKQTYSL